MSSFGYNYPGTSNFDRAVIGSLVGSASNDSAAAGAVGEIVSSSIPSGSAVSVITDGVYNITSIALTPGDWDVRGHANFWLLGATPTQLLAGVSSTSSGMPADGTEVYSNAGNKSLVLTGVDSISLRDTRFSLSANTTVYLMGRCVFSAGLISGFGGLYGRRVR